MNRKRVLIAGGYGTVSSVVSEHLAKDENILPVIAGRNKKKAAELAKLLDAEYRTIDVTDKQGMTTVLEDIAIVINCFSGPFTNFPIDFPMLAAQKGVHYLDVAGSYEYAERFLTLNELAMKNKATLITALGANPGIPGIVLMKEGTEFDKLESGKLYFVLGARFDGVSVSSLKELNHMFNVKPLIWDKSHWVKPKISSMKEYMGEPFEKEIYLGLSLTRDLLVLPELTSIDNLSLWSGSQSALQGIVMILGLKMGLSKRDSTAQFLLNVLKKIGKTENSISESLMKVELVGQKDGVRKKSIVEIYCDENYATAIAPVLVCQQLVEGKITKYGAFVPPEIVPARNFTERLEEQEMHLSTTVKQL